MNVIRRQYGMAGKAILVVESDQDLNCDLHMSMLPNVIEFQQYHL